MKLETERLVLRDFHPHEWHRVQKFASTEALSRHLSFGEIATESGAQSYVKKALADAGAFFRSSYKLAVSIKPDNNENELVGSCWLDMDSDDHSMASIGYFVACEYWGKGYATEMVAELIRFGFQELKLRRLYANCDADNIASRKVLEKNGMSQEGVLRQHCRREHGLVDVCYYGILDLDITS
ncbi:MAG: GNAT family N-acetyltransferase [Candidatus Obscuribacterales bacterium]|nr:GNAT family N-acetyltransferase [Candidatus Obscuribacterales bacterium]